MRVLAIFILVGAALHGIRPAAAAEVSMSRGASSRPGSGPAVLRSATLDARDTVTAVVAGRVAPGPERFSLVGPGGARRVAAGSAKHGPEGTVRVTLCIDPVGDGDFPAFNHEEWRLSLDGQGAVPVRLGKVVDDPHFEFRGEMGLIRRAGGALMRVFAPTARAVTLRLRRTPGSTPREVPLLWQGHGVWEATVADLEPAGFYTVRVEKGGRVFEGIDPYSRANTAHDGLAIHFCDDTRVCDPPVFDNSENIVYEMHLRDMTIHPKSGVVHKGKYLGMAEEGTRHADDRAIRTGLDHLVELGVNTIHIMPVADFVNDERSDAYNWGYMPVHFNSPDGWYATRTDTPARVVELKRLVDALHRKGLKVVLDVVYNHTAEGSPDVAFGFNAMTDGYYYRRRDDGSYSNGSGCGNEFRSESRMGRKFIVDSLRYWATEYRVDGFRFDLLGLIDLETIERAVRALKKVNPNIFVYGEPWAAGDTTIRKTGKGDQRSRGFAVFNDGFRDAIKGSVFDLSRGYVQSGVDRDRVMRGIAGSLDDFTDAPGETINYVSCHDNHTLWDRIVLSTRGSATAARQREMAKLAQAIVLTSQGIPFLHAGEEFLRTKHGEENSFDKPDSINRIDWDRKRAHRDVFEYYRDLIALRKAHPAFRMKTASEVRANLRFFESLGLRPPGRSIAYVLEGAAVGDPWRRIVVLVNPDPAAAEFELPPGTFEVGADRSGTRRLAAGPVSGRFRAGPISLTVLYQR